MQDPARPGALQDSEASNFEEEEHEERRSVEQNNANRGEWQALSDHPQNLLDVVNLTS